MPEPSGHGRRPLRRYQNTGWIVKSLLLTMTQERSRSYHANREVAGGEAEYYFYARLPQAVAMTTS